MAAPFVTYFQGLVNHAVVHAGKTYYVESVNDDYVTLLDPNAPGAKNGQSVSLLVALDAIATIYQSELKGTETVIIHTMKAT